MPSRRQGGWGLSGGKLRRSPQEWGCGFSPSDPSQGETPGPASAPQLPGAQTSLSQVRTRPLPGLPQLQLPLDWCSWQTWPPKRKPEHHGAGPGPHPACPPPGSGGRSHLRSLPGGGDICRQSWLPPPTEGLASQKAQAGPQVWGGSEAPGGWCWGTWGAAAASGSPQLARQCALEPGAPGQAVLR